MIRPSIIAAALLMAVPAIAQQSGTLCYGNGCSYIDSSPAIISSIPLTPTPLSQFTKDFEITGPIKWQLSTGPGPSVVVSMEGRVTCYHVTQKQLDSMISYRGMYIALCAHRKRHSH